MAKTTGASTVTLAVPSGIIPLKIKYYERSRNGSSANGTFKITLNYSDGTNEAINQVYAKTDASGTWNECTGNCYLGYDIEKLSNITSIVMTNPLGYQFGTQYIAITEWIEK